MPNIRDITPQVLRVFEADRSMPRAFHGIIKVLRDEQSMWPTQQQMRAALAKLQKDGIVVEVMGGNITWSFKGKTATTPYYILTEAYNAQRDEVAEAAAQAADIQLRSLHGSEWDELYKSELTYQGWRKQYR